MSTAIGLRVHSAGTSLTLPDAFRPHVAISLILTDLLLEFLEVREAWFSLVFYSNHVWVKCVDFELFSDTLAVKDDLDQTLPAVFTDPAWLLLIWLLPLLLVVCAIGGLWS